MFWTPPASAAASATGLTVTGPKEWYAGKPDADLDATAAMLAETRYYTESGRE